jgi:TyrR family helix-turn-helix protein
VCACPLSCPGVSVTPTCMPCAPIRMVRLEADFLDKLSPVENRPSPAHKKSLDEALQEVERQMVVRSYQKCGSSRKVAADLNVSQTRASRLIRKYCGHRADSE